MRLVCPHCMSGVTVPDDAAGKDAPCPNCGKSFPTPPRYTPEVAPAPAPVSAPAPTPAAPPPVPQVPPVSEVAPAPHAAPPAPPGLAPPVAPSGFLPPPAPVAAEVPAVAGYTKSVGLTISPTAIAWLPSVLLTAVFVFTFFPWVGCYTGGTAVYSQRSWGAMFGGSPNRNYKLEEAGTIPGLWLDKMRSDWKTMVPFFLLLGVALVFAWTERGLRSFDPRKVPPLAKLWPWRNAIVAGCAGAILLLLVVQWLNGFGMERAIKQHIAEQFAAAREQAAGSPAAQAKLEYVEEQEFHKYNVEHTSWMYLALACSALAVLAVMTRAGLDARGNKPAPKIVLHY